MIALILPLLARWRVPANLQRFLAILIVIAAFCLLAWGATLIVRGFIDRERNEAVQIDRIDGKAIAVERQANAEREASAAKHADELAAERALAARQEAINATEHEPNGDPWAALLNGL